MDEFDKIVSEIDVTDYNTVNEEDEMDMPDVTRAQIIAMVQAALGMAIAFGAPITESQSLAVMTLVGVIAAVLIHSDKGLRAARNETMQVQIAADSELEQMRLGED